jgi:hypothetical protein
MGRLARSVARGTGLGLFLAGLFLLVWAAVSSAQVECGELTAQECAVAREVARSGNRRELALGGVLLLLGGATLVTLHSSRPR